MKFLGSFIIVVMLSGCEQFSIIQGVIAISGAKASDRALSSCSWEVCIASPIGAIERKFDTPEKLATYQEFCEVAQ